MAFKAIVFCASALFVQCALGNCLGRIGNPLAAPLAARPALGLDGMACDGWAYDGLAGWSAGRLGCGGYGPAVAPVADIAVASSLNAAYGGGLPIASASAAAPTGLAVASDNAYEGTVAVAGNLPFLGTVAMEGVFPTAGAGAISYGCGDGIVAMTAEGPIAGPLAMAPLGLAIDAPIGYANRGCGCGGPYRY